jgi:hypothetical protein
MQIYRVCMHAIINERHFFLKKRNVLGIGYRVLDTGYRVWVIGG